jgi:hypothetical protein
MFPPMQSLRVAHTHLFPPAPRRCTGRPEPALEQESSIFAIRVFIFIHLYVVALLHRATHRARHNENELSSSAQFVPIRPPPHHTRAHESKMSPLDSKRTAIGGRWGSAVPRTGSTSQKGSRRQKKYSHLLRTELCRVGVFIFIQRTWGRW